ncbi:MoaD/ThiS family protein, partial [Blastococcus sp. KM273129]|uniref:MoaD/ThiS family protein n=1 Tax=Blastococcus sp. KM273129 TaxID=2570315 RepID=UPI001F3F8A49
MLPGSLADLAGGSRHLRVDPDGATLAAVLDAVAAAHPVLGRRIRDEAGAVRRFVNVYVDGEDVRWRRRSRRGCRGTGRCARGRRCRRRRAAPRSRR